MGVGNQLNKYDNVDEFCYDFVKARKSAKKIAY